MGVDELISRTNLTASQVLATLSVLELKRLVRRLPGHQSVRAWRLPLPVDWSTIAIRPGNDLGFSWMNDGTIQG